MNLSCLVDYLNGIVVDTATTITTTTTTTTRRNIPRKSPHHHTTHTNCNADSSATSPTTNTKSLRLLMAFDSESVPTISISDYARRLLSAKNHENANKNAREEGTLACMLIQRLRDTYSSEPVCWRVTQSNIHRLFLVCLLVAEKCLQDTVRPTLLLEMGVRGGVPARELARLEIVLLTALSFHLYVNPLEFTLFCATNCSCNGCYCVSAPEPETNASSRLPPIRIKHSFSAHSSSLLCAPLDARCAIPASSSESQLCGTTRKANNAARHAFSSFSSRPFVAPSHRIPCTTSNNTGLTPAKHTHCEASVRAHFPSYVPA